MLRHTEKSLTKTRVWSAV